VADDSFICEECKEKSPYLWIMKDKRELCEHCAGGEPDEGADAVREPTKRTVEA